MLGKMFSYDFKALARVLLPIQFAVVAVGAICGMAGFVGNFTSEHAHFFDRFSYGSSDLILGIALVIVGFSVLLLFCSAIATFIVILVRFFKNLFTDEGYLTLTLPLKTWQLLMSKVLTGLIWIVINAVVVLLALGVFSVTSGEFDMSSPMDVIPIWVLQAADSGIFAMGDEITSVLVLVRLLVSMVVQMLFVLMMAYASFCLGAAAASKHKVAAAICIFIGIWVLYNMFFGFFSVGVYLGNSSSIKVVQFILAVISFVLEIALIIACWFICVWVLKKRVNLS